MTEILTTHAGSLPRTPALIEANAARPVGDDGLTPEPTDEFREVLRSAVVDVVAKQRAKEAGAWEAVLVRDGAITEGSSTNVFGVIDGVIRTYPKCNYILPGVSRDVVIGLARELDLRVDESPIFVDEVPRLQELFLSGTTTEIQPITRLDGSPVGDGRPGPVALSLFDALQQYLGVGAHASVS